MQLNRYGVALALFLFLTVGKFHNSSLAEWNHFLSRADSDTRTSPLLGVSRAIRTDEYFFLTPLFLAQAKASPHPFALVNGNLRASGHNMLAGIYAPIWHISNLVKPANWGYLLFGNEVGLSWSCVSRLLLVFFFSFELILVLTAGNRLLAWLGAFWITFSGIVQWWFSTPFVDLIIYSEGLCLAAARWGLTSHKLARAAWALLGAACSAGFTLSLYPPLQVFLSYFLIFGATTLFFTRNQFPRPTRLDITVAGLFFTGAAAIVAVSGWEMWEALSIEAHTFFPGRRVSTGGDLSPALLQLYLVGWLLPFKEVGFLNQCEASSVLNFLPTIFLLLAAKLYERRAFPRLLLGWMGLILVFTCFALLGFPLWIAKGALLSYVPSHRIHFLIGLVSLFPTLWLLSQSVAVQTRLAHIFCAFLSLLYFFSLKASPMLGYAGKKGALVILVAMYAANFFLLTARVRPFALAVLLIGIIPNALVNPVDRGLAPIEGAAITEAIREVENQNPGQRWIGLNDKRTGALLTSVGVKTLTGPHWYPDLDLWRSLDPSPEAERVYNRYGYSSAMITEGKTYFKLIHPDEILVAISWRDLKRVRAKWALSVGKVPGLTEIKRVEKDNLYIYDLDTALDKMVSL